VLWVFLWVWGVVVCDIKTPGKRKPRPGGGGGGLLRQNKKKIKAIPLQAWTGPGGSLEV